MNFSRKIIVFLSSSIILSRKIYDQWQDAPTVTTISTTGYPIKNIEFPAITICSQGAANDLMDMAMMKQFERYLKSHRNITSQHQGPNVHRQDIIQSLSNEEVLSY